MGVRTAELSDSERDRYLPVEVWYPATDAYSGKDLDEGSKDEFEAIPGFPPVSQEAVRDAESRDGSFPLVAFSHGFGGHRRQTTHLCCHLASHGYVVAAVDHTGNTIVDMMQLMMQTMNGEPEPDPATVMAMIADIMQARPLDISFMIDRVLDGEAAGLSAVVDAERVGMTGHSFGGWTTLKVAGSDGRISCAMPLAPAGGASPLPADPLREALDFDWGREVPTLYLVADRDTLLPLGGMHELLGRTNTSKKMVVLKDADHMHFCDNVEATHEMFRSMPPPGALGDMARATPPISEFCPGEQAYTYLRGLGTAHMDATLKGNEAAAAFLAGDVPAALAARGVQVEVF